MEICFVTLFAIEAIVKLVALGWRRYFMSKFNCFDCTIVFVSVLEVAFVYGIPMQPVGLSSLRAIRLFRVFRDWKPLWEELQDLSASLLGSITSIGSLLLLVVIYMTVISLLAMQLFGGRQVINYACI